jgi:hypothetical protein
VRPKAPLHQRALHSLAATAGRSRIAA